MSTELKIKDYTKNEIAIASLEMTNHLHNLVNSLSDKIRILRNEGFKEDRTKIQRNSVSWVFEKESDFIEITYQNILNSSNIKISAGCSIQKNFKQGTKTRYSAKGSLSINKDIGNLSLDEDEYELEQAFTTALNIKKSFKYLRHLGEVLDDDLVADKNSKDLTGKRNSRLSKLTSRNGKFLPKYKSLVSNFIRKEEDFQPIDFVDSVQTYRHTTSSDNISIILSPTGDNVDGKINAIKNYSARGTTIMGRINVSLVFPNIDQGAVFPTYFKSFHLEILRRALVINDVYNFLSAAL